MKMKVSLPVLKKIGIVIVGLIAANEILPYYAKAKAKVIRTVKGA